METRINLAAGDELRGGFASRENVTRRYVEGLSRLAFSAPGIVEAIRQRRQPAELSTETLLNRIDLPPEWPAQLKDIGID